LLKIKVDKSDLLNLTLKLKGLERLGVNVKEEINFTAGNIVRDMKIDAPAKFGELRRGINHTRTTNGNQITSVVEYSPYQEFGTRYETIKTQDMTAIGIPRSYALQFKASPLIKATNIKAKEFFFKNARIGYESLLRKIDLKLKKLSQ